MNAMEPEYDVDFTGKTIDRYAILGLIQAGGQGTVYRGRDQWLQREVAIKVLPPRGEADAGPPHALIAEGQRLSQINDPHVAGVYDFVKHDDRDFLVMEFVPGATLHELLKNGPLPLPEILRLGSQLARGLAAAHAARIIHCDIKPENLKIASSGELKILDFGVAARGGRKLVWDDSTTQTPSRGHVSGTVPYMSPEQLRGEVVDERSDIFSAGAVLYEMATGRRSFPHRDLARLVEALQYETPPRPSSINPAVPVALDRVIEKALEKKASARHGSAVELAIALDDLRVKAIAP
jgi:serine/threonine protein kinase